MIAPIIVKQSRNPVIINPTPKIAPVIPPAIPTMPGMLDAIPLAAFDVSFSRCFSSHSLFFKPEILVIYFNYLFGRL